ncbi:ArsR/SmtB family transcription factor [Ignatzschineria cameli]|uniref:Transcriptional regulator n=1 Tax=Ignatzschineria cameli TaxID=2182793 RepID=A0A2U2ATK0_9GAMM|nr:helix-turn-helix domain-containing protein [Ignatzschineria cameli]PWD88060.1 transcriptional regulator [Ignatzschineria cameli]PWD91091.1 transcriptional regulator [Ignatzschineria cameli]PWD92733.1 transcriptional regulator [Ignatzschineria cameli]PWD93753.1 transcriptional regulator [Ignatzschineria cameli]
MEKKIAIKMFEALSSEVRLDVYRLLVKYGDSGLVAGEIATLLDIPNTNLSFHLKALVHAEMLYVEQEGRFLRYKANIDLMLSLVEFLTDECCFNNPNHCLSIREKHPKLKNVLR